MASVESYQQPAAPPQQQQQQQQQHVSPQQALSLLTPDQLRGMIQRARTLQKEGYNEKTSPELARIRNILVYYQTYHKATLHQQQSYIAHRRAAEYPQPPTVNGWTNHSDSSSSEGSGESSTTPTILDPAMAAFLNGPPPPEPEANQPVIFTPSQLNTLRHQIHAYKLISRGLPVPPHILQGIQASEKLVERLEAVVDTASRSWLDRIVDNTVRMHAGATWAGEKHDAQGDVEMQDAADNMGASEDPSDARNLPFTHLRRLVRSGEPLQATKHQRLLIPPTAPANLDPLQLVAERNHFVDARIAQRIKELEALPISIGDAGRPSFHPSELDTDPSSSGPASAKIRALIELKSLHLREKQRQLRQDVISTYTRSSFINQSQTRAALTKLRQQTVRDARTTELLEKKHREERVRKSKQKQLDYLAGILTHGREMMAARKAAHLTSQKFGRSVLKFHADWEKEENRRMEKTGKERLKALKNDDEEAYMKLIDSVKDTRITHLLRQTNQYLESLTQAVIAQQKAGGGVASMLDGDEIVTEATFGAAAFDDGVPSNDKTKLDYYAVSHRISEKVTAQPALLVGGTLKDYQLKGLQWMLSLYNNKLNGILADEMGLGKTIQTISLITYLIEKKRQPGPYLVIVPLSTLTNWTLEFQKWAPSVTTIVYKGAPNVRRNLQGQIRQTAAWQVLLTTYEYIIKDRPVLSKIRWLHMIIDEGHRMKNSQSRLSTTLSQYYMSRYRLILTGTPLQNNLPELWALLNFVLPNIFNSSESFAEWFSRPFANTGGEKVELNEEEALLVIRGLHKVLRPFLLRRLKKDVESELPDKTEKVIKCRMSTLQQRMYDWMKKHKAVLTIAGDGKASGGKGVNNTMMQLRKICNHPFLFRGVEDDVNPTRALDENVYRVSGKFELLDRMLPKLFRTGHRVLLFFQMTEVMTIIEDYFRFRDYAYLRLDGMTKSDERAELLQKFNAPDSPYKLFILSTRAGGLGLNLQTADTVVIFDSDWNPHADLQAQDRAHRIGQKKAVSVFRLVTEKSVEEHMLARARDKLDMDGKVIQAGRFDNKSTAKEQEDLLRQLLEADAADDQDEGVQMTNEELNEILARGDDEEEVFLQIDKEREIEETRAWKAKGGRGPHPERLIQDSELPPEYINPRSPASKIDHSEVTGRGQRVKGPVHYSDGLTDDQFLRAIENEEVDLLDVVEKKRLRKERKEAKKAGAASGALSSARDTPDTPMDQGAASTAEPSRAVSLPKVEEPEASAGPSPAPAIATPKKRGKRKREESQETPTTLDTPDGAESLEPDVKRQKAAIGVKRGRKPNPFKERLRAVLLECFNTVQNCIAPDGHQRCELFKELPDKKLYPDYYMLIQRPIAMAAIRKKIYANTYKTVTQCRDDFQLMFNNARTYNADGSWVYVDAEELEKTFNEVYTRLTVGSGLPGAEGGEGDDVKPGEGSADVENDAMDIDPPAPVAPPSQTLKIKLKRPAA